MVALSCSLKGPVIFLSNVKKTANERRSSIHVEIETQVFFKILTKMGTPYFFFVESSDILTFPKL